ncbi:unnamed protein product [Closterium sp. Yama58-4]|nr:unnamed protein product [Closterium sp. Yama58-4]
MTGNSCLVCETVFKDDSSLVGDEDTPAEGEHAGSSEDSVRAEIFDTLTELYLFFRDADLSHREVNRLLHIFRNPRFNLRALRRWRNWVDVRRWGMARAPADMVPWKTEEIVVRGPKGMQMKLLLHFRDTELILKKLVRTFSSKKGFVWKPRKIHRKKNNERVFEGPETGDWMHAAQKEINDEDALILGVLIYSDSTQASRNGRRNAWPVLISLINIPAELRGVEPGHTLAAVLPFPPEWASSTEKTRVFQEAIKINLAPIMRESASAPVRFFYCTDADGKVHKAVPCLYGYPADFPESSRASATLQQGSHRPCANCYADKGEFTMMVGKVDPRTPEKQRDIVRQILACKKQSDADDVRRLWSTHPIECVLHRWNFADTEWGNVYLACLADTLHVLDSGVLIHMMDTYIEPLGKVEMRLLEQRKKEFKAITPSVLLRIPRGSAFFSSGANYAAFEHRSMMQIMPILVADESALKGGEEGELRALQVKAFRLFAVFYKAFLGVDRHTHTTIAIARQHAIALVELLPRAFPKQASHWRLSKIHMIRHLLDNVVHRGMPHHYSTEMWERTHKGTVKGPVRGSNWSDIPRRIVEEEVQREVYREVAADAGGGRQYATALSEAIKTRKPVLTKKYRIMRIGGESDPVYNEYTAALGDEMKGMADEFKALGLSTNNVQVHTAVAIPRTRGGELVAKGTFVKASPRERWYSDVALLNNKKGDWFARCLCIFRAVDREGDWKGYAYVRYYEGAGRCKLTGCKQLHKKVDKVFTEFVETVNGVHFSRDRNTLILTIHEAYRITGEVARPVTEHGFSVQHLTNTRIVNIRGSVPEGGLPHLQGVEDALKGHYRVMLMKRAIAAKRFQFDYSASIADVDYGLMLEWLGEAWTRVRAVTMQRSWWRAGCVPPSWPPLMAYLSDTSATGMFEPLIAICVELQLLIEKFKMRPACYMTAAEFVNCDAGLCVEQGFRATPAASASDDSSGEMSLPDGPLLRDERSRRRVIRNVTNAYVERADALGIPPALVPAEVGASNQEVISRLGRTPVKRARAGMRPEDVPAPAVRETEDDE